MTSLLPSGPVQAFWGGEETAVEMMYLWLVSQDLIAKTPPGTAPASYTDVHCGSRLLRHFRNGDIGSNDTVLTFSIDGTKLYRNKESDCWIYIWLVENLSPDRCFKKCFILPGGVIPGPNHPVNLDSFIYRGIYHVSALMREGLPIWNVHTQGLKVLCPCSSGRWSRYGTTGWNCRPPWCSGLSLLLWALWST